MKFDLKQKSSTRYLKIGPIIFYQGSITELKKYRKNLQEITYDLVFVSVKVIQILLL